MCCRGKGWGPGGVGEHWNIKLSNAKAFMKEGEGDTTGRANYVWTVAGHGSEVKGYSNPRAKDGE